MTLAATVLRVGLDAGVTMATVPIVDRGRGADRAAGLAAAHAAFALAGVPGGGIIGHEPDGRPRWPPAWTGSVAHGGGHAVCGVAALGVCRGLGVDIERAAALPLDDAVVVLDDAEHSVAAVATDPAGMATLLWSAKESAFKAWSVMSGGLRDVDPVDIHIEIDVTSRRLQANATGTLLAASSALDALTGTYAIVDGLVVTVLRPPTPSATRW